MMAAISRRSVVLIIGLCLQSVHGQDANADPEESFPVPTEPNTAPAVEEVWTAVPPERLPCEVTIFTSPILRNASIGNWSMPATYQLRFFTLPKQNSKPMMAMPMPQMPKYVPDLSICYWIRPQNSSENCVFWHGGKGSLMEIISCVLKKDNEIGVLFKRSEEDKIVVPVTNIAELNKLQSNGWMHVCTLWSSNQGYWKIILNAQTAFQGEGLATGKLVNPWGWQGIGIGPNKIPFEGDLSELHVWNRLLEHEEVYQAAMGLLDGNVMGWKSMSMSMLHGVVLDPSVKLPWRNLFPFFPETTAANPEEKKEK